MAATFGRDFSSQLSPNLNSIFGFAHLILIFI
jgi:hypothetical protein